MSARLTLTNCAWKNVWRRRWRACLTRDGIDMQNGAYFAPVGIARGLERESMNLTETDK